MLPIEFRYRHRYYKTLTDTFTQVIETAIINRVNDQLSHLRHSILLQGGQVVVQMVDKNSYQIEVKGVSDELKQRACEAMMLN